TTTSRWLLPRAARGACGRCEPARYTRRQRMSSRKHGAETRKNDERKESGHPLARVAAERASDRGSAASALATEGHEADDARPHQEEGARLRNELEREDAHHRQD